MSQKNQITSIQPKIFPGKVTKENKGAIDWGYQGLVAYGCQSYVVIVEPVQLIVVQTLDEHRGYVQCVKWQKQPQVLFGGFFSGPSATASPSSLGTSPQQKLTATSMARVLSGPTMDDKQNSTKLKLATADHLGCLMIWNTLDGSVIRTFSQDITQKAAAVGVQDIEWVDFDGQENILALYSNNQLILWNAISGDKVWKVDLPRDETFASFAQNPFQHTLLSVVAPPSGTIYFIKEIDQLDSPKTATVRLSISSAKQQKTDDAPMFKHMIFSPHFRDLIYIVLAREIVVFDLNLDKSLSTISIDRSKASFQSIVVSHTVPHLIYAVHEDGGLSTWKKKEGNYKYERVCGTEGIRSGRYRKKGFFVLGFVKSPLDDKLVTLTNDGTLWMTEHIAESAIHRFCLTGISEGISSPITALSSYPYPKDPLRHCLVIGTLAGSVQVLDLLRTLTHSEFSVFPGQPIRGVKWISDYEVICWIIEEVGKTQFKNQIAILDIRTGKQKEIRKISGNETTFIRAIKISYARQYCIILLKDRPFELWDLTNLSLIRTFKSYSMITALEWFPNRTDSSKGVKEQFIFTLPDATLKYFTVENKVLATMDLSADLGQGWVSALAWKDDFIVGGNALGEIHVWNTRTNKSMVFATPKGAIKRINFSPSSSLHQIMVLFNEGDIGIWDLDHGVKVSASNYLKGRDLKAIDCDWISESIPIVATSDGCLRVLDRSMSISNSPVLYSQIPSPIATPYLLLAAEALILKVLMQHYTGSLSFVFKTEKVIDTAIQNFGQLLELGSLCLIRAVPEAELTKLAETENIAEKGLLTARFFGHSEEIMFWSSFVQALEDYSTLFPKSQRIDVDSLPTLSTQKESPVTHNLTPFSSPKPLTPLNKFHNSSSPLRELRHDKTPAPSRASSLNSNNNNNDDETSTNKIAHTKNNNNNTSATNENEISESENFEAEENLENEEEKEERCSRYLGAPFVSSSRALREDQAERITLPSLQQASYDQVKKVASLNILLGNKTKAMDLLIQTPIENPSSRTDYLKSLVIAGSLGQEAFQNTIKFVSSHLIAHGNLDEAVELLSLIGRGLDACNYLQAYERWSEAAHLAKISLPPSEQAIVMRRWANHLCLGAVKDKMKAANIFLSLGEFHPALQCLEKIGRVDLAGPCVGVLIDRDYFAKGDVEARPKPNPQTKDFFTLETSELVSRILNDYCTLLNKLNLTDALQYYRAKATTFQNIVKPQLE